MINDFLDIVNPRGRFTAAGNYYAKRPISPEDGPVQFFYEAVSPYSNTYRRLFGNIQGTDGTIAIRTNDQCGFCVGGYIVTSDGVLFEIIQVEKDFQAAPKQVLRLFGTPIATEYVLRLVVADDPWGLL